jgi:hypothetical protein
MYSNLDNYINILTFGLFCVITNSFFLNIYIRGITNFNIFEPIHYILINYIVLYYIKCVSIIDGNSLFFFISDKVNERAFIWAIYYSIVWLIIFQIAYYSKDNLALKFPYLRSLNIRKLKFWIPIFLILGVLSIFLKIYLMGGVSVFLFSPDEVKVKLGMTPINLMTTLPQYALYLSLIGYLLTRSKYLLSLILIAFSISLSYWLLCFSKHGIINVVYIPLMIYCFVKKRSLQLKTIILLSIVCICVFTIIDTWRQYKHDESQTYLWNDILNYKDHLSTNIRNDYNKTLTLPLNLREGIEAFAIVIRDDHDNKAIDMFYRLLISLIPRLIWPNKPIISEGTLFINDYLKVNTVSSASITILTSSYYMFGILGIIGTSWLVGIFLRSFYHYTIMNLNNSGIVFCYAIFFDYIITFFQIGIIDFLNGIAPIILYFGTFYFLLRNREGSLRTAYKIRSNFYLR